MNLHRIVWFWVAVLRLTLILSQETALESAEETVMKEVVEVFSLEVSVNLPNEYALTIV